MELIAIAPKDLLNEKDWGGVKKKYKVTFVKNDEIKTFNYNFNNEPKALLIDPDFIDWEFPNEILYNTKNLKKVFLTTTTASYVDEKYLKENGIKLFTIPKYSTNSVAEYLVFLMFCLSKKLPLQLKNNSKQDFSNEFLQMELTGKTVGVVGYGNIGKRICEITKSIGMTPTYYNRTEKESNFKAVTLSELFANSDVIFITLSNTPETKNIVTNKLLLSMKKTAILISGTGIELHNDNIVRNMLKDNKLYGFGAELPNKSYKDYGGNAMITSEYAWFTSEATERRIQIIIKNLLENFD